MSLLGAALLAAILGVPAGDDVFVRDLKTIDDVVRDVHLRAASEKRSRLVVCLDDELLEKERWFDALSKEFKSQPIDLVITSRSAPTKRLAKAGPVAPPKKGGLAGAIRDSWSDSAVTERSRTPVLDWTRSIVPFAGRGAAVVFISSCGPGGSWAAPKSERDFDDCIDPCWHEEEVGADFTGSGVSLWIVAPEAPFGLDAAVTLCRFLPYANRPLLNAGGASRLVTLLLPHFDGGRMPTPEELDELLKKQLFDPRFSGVLPSSIRHKLESASSPETDVPSGTANWSYARACFLGRGHCYVFGGGRDGILDRCDRTSAFDDFQSPVDRSAKAQWDAVTAQPAVRQLREFVAGALAASRDWFVIVQPSRRPGVEASGDRQRAVDVFETPGIPRTILVDADDFDARECERWPEFSRLLRPPIAAHDRAWMELSHSLDLDPATWQQLGPRARNDALVERFWLKMSAFHLESLRVLTADPERILIQPKKGWRGSVTPYEAIRLSDCLEAYDGRRIASELEFRFGRHRRRFLDHGSAQQFDQSNELVQDRYEPNYRAQRDDLEPIANLDDSLKTRALDLIATAREIHDSCRGTPWDWLIYHASIDVYRFVPGTAVQRDSMALNPDSNGLDVGGSSTEE